MQALSNDIIMCFQSGATLMLRLNYHTKGHFETPHSPHGKVKMKTWE